KQASPGFLFAQFQILGKELQQRRRGGLRDSQRRPDSPCAAVPGRRARELSGSAGSPKRKERRRRARKGTRATVTPTLSGRNGASAVEFYKAAFGATEVFRIDGEGGAVVARLSVDGAEFWVADESPEHFNFSPESLGGGSVRMVMVVDDPDSAFNRA